MENYKVIIINMKENGKMMKNMEKDMNILEMIKTSKLFIKGYFIIMKEMEKVKSQIIILVKKNNIISMEILKITKNLKMVC